MQQVLSVVFIYVFSVLAFTSPLKLFALAESQHSSRSSTELSAKEQKLMQRFSKRARVKRLFLVNPETGRVIKGYAQLKKKASIDLDELKLDSVILKALVRPGRYGSLVFEVTELSEINSEIKPKDERILYSRARGEEVYVISASGDYLIKATPYFGENGAEPAGKSRTLRVRVKGQGGQGTGGGSGKKPKSSPTPEPTTSPTPTPQPSPEPSPQPSASATPSPSPSATPQPVEMLRVNIGGGAYTDSVGRIWSADSGLPISGFYSPYSFIKSIANTSDDTIYHSEVWGNYDYAFPYGNGFYRVEMHFAEIYFINTGERVFDVSIEGQKKLSNFDIVASAGPNTAHVQSFDVSVIDGILNIALTPISNQAKLSGLVISRIGDSAPTATPTPDPSPTASPSASPSPSSTPTPSPSSSPTPPAGPGMISAVWANDGGDKVTRDELRVSGPAPRNVLNSIWDGSQVNLFGAKNEVVAFNLVLEAANGNTSGVTVSLNQLSGPGGFTISSATTSGNGVFNYVGRNIELFFVRYLQIKGLSKLFYEHYDERHIPKRFQRPYTGAGYGTGTWQDRPDHDKFYPDIAVPLELEGQFTIASGSNQSIWTDIYIPKNAPAGFYNGTINITEGGALTRQVPVSLEVRNFSLPDTPSSQTMLYLGYTDVNRRYLGVDYPSGAAATTSTQIRDRHFQMAHRHKIQVIDNDNGSSAWGLDQPRPEWLPRLNGSLFSSAKGYDGPGVNTGNGVYSIGTYSTWNWKNEGETGMRTHSNNWVNWFDSNSPATEYFLYLIDESSNYAQTNTWAQWINNNPGTGNRLMSFATASIPHAVSQMPQLDIAAGWMASGITSEWENAVNQLSANPDKRAYMYNGKRPASGSFAIEDDGVALRELPWGQYKKKIDRWFFWESTYYNNYQGGQGQTNVFQKAATFGGYSGFNSSIGETGWNYSNGDGLLFYPGTDVIFPNESYGVLGPIASLRLKYWRRGIQDIDYVKMAAQINPTATQNIVQQMVPSVMWEPGISDPNDPTWVRTDISWSIDPDDWEIAREQLADIIEGN